MLTDITLGQFFPGNSVLHRMDPRVKVGLLCAMIAGVFAFHSWACYALLSAAILVLSVVPRLPLKMLFRSLKPMWWILFFTFAIHLCATPGTVFFHVWILDFTWEGLSKGGILCLRLMLLILLATLLTFTTSPLALTDAIEHILSPLKGLGVPAHELAMMMTIALRFVPTILEETDKIMKAQQARGSDFSTGNVMTRMMRLTPILVPLFISAFRRADELAMAMEARSYRGGVGRTRMKVLAVSAVDYGAMAATVLLLATLAALKYAGI